MTPFQSFIHVAHGPNTIERIIFGFILITIISILGDSFLIWMLNLGAHIGLTASQDNAIAYLRALDTDLDPTAAQILLFSFIGLWAGVYTVGRVMHNQPFGTFFSPDSRIHIRPFLQGIALGVFFAALSIVCGFLLVGNVRPGLEPYRLAAIILPLIATTFIQATAEELVFRGYLLQQLGLRSQHWLVWALLPSLLFGVLHYDPDLPDDCRMYYMASAFLAGLVLCALVWRSGNLWSAIGLHLAINTISLSIVGIEDYSISSTQLWLIGKESTVLTLFQIDIVINAMMLAFVLAPTGRFFEPDGGKPKTG